MTRLATFNIRGSKPNFSQLTKLLHVETICLTKTWAESFETSLYSLHATGIKSSNRHRLGGEVSIVSIHPLTLQETVSSAKIQAVTARSKGTTIIAVYLPPSQNKAQVQQSLALLTRFIRGPTIICGDFNGRRKPSHYRQQYTLEVFPFSHWATTTSPLRVSPEMGHLKHIVHRKLCLRNTLPQDTGSPTHRGNEDSELPPPCCLQPSTHPPYGVCWERFKNPHGLLPPLEVVRH